MDDDKLRGKQMDNMNRKCIVENHLLQRTQSNVVFSAPAVPADFVNLSSSSHKVLLNHYAAFYDKL